jgi:hypothetical protein
MDTAFRRVIARRGATEVCTSQADCRKSISWEPWGRTQDRFGKVGSTARAVTVWVFLAQCLSSNHRCREAVARLIRWRLAKRLKS